MTAETQSHLSTYRETIVLGLKFNRAADHLFQVLKDDSQRQELKETIESAHAKIGSIDWDSFDPDNAEITKVFSTLVAIAKETKEGKKMLHSIYGIDEHTLALYESGQSRPSGETARPLILQLKDIAQNTFSRLAQKIDLYESPSPIYKETALLGWQFALEFRFISQTLETRPGREMLQEIVTKVREKIKSLDPIDSFPDALGTFPLLIAIKRATGSEKFLLNELNIDEDQLRAYESGRLQPGAEVARWLIPTLKHSVEKSLSDIEHRIDAKEKSHQAWASNWGFGKGF